MSNEERYATLTPIGSEGEKIAVQFNPASLEYQVTNTLQEQQGAQGAAKKGTSQRKQYTTQSTAKLTMDLIFDTTDNGVDVRVYTGIIASFMKPKGDDKNAVPPVVEFAWGSYFFKGMIESFKETIDFFHPDGVPLRSTVNLVMAAQDKVFESSGGTGDNAPVEPAQVPFSSGQNPTSLAKKAGNPRAGGAIAAANGQETMRFSTGPLTVSASIPLKGPSAFVKAGGGAGAGAGLGIKGRADLSGGLGIQGGAGLGVNGKKIASINVVSGGGAIKIGGGLSVRNDASFSTSFGSKSSAGVSASAGAFAGIGASVSASASFKLDTSKLISVNGAAGLSTGVGASFGIGGAAGGGALADVKAEAKIRVIFTEG
jgi:hypothetical protein